MGRSSKFSFPLPGRKGHAERLSPSKKSLSAWATPNVEDAPVSKAEKLLGTPGLTIQPELRSHMPPQPRPALRSQSSYMTFTVSEGSYAESSNYADPHPPAAMEEVVIPPRSHSLRPVPSSSALGPQRAGDASKAGSVSNSTTRRIPDRDSSSTLRSFYDPAKSPLAVSQQTSDSAVRDMALRKGCPTIVSENGASTSTLRLPRGSVTQEYAPEDSRKKRPAKLDVSKLFHRPKTPSRDAFSPNEPNTPATPASMLLDPFSRQAHPGANPEVGSVTGRTKSNRLSKFGRKSALQQSQPQPQPVAQPRPQLQSQVDARQRSSKRESFDSAKVNVRRPPPGIQNWFDGLLEESEDDEELVSPRVGAQASRSGLTAAPAGRPPQPKQKRDANRQNQVPQSRNTNGNAAFSTISQSAPTNGAHYWRPESVHSGTSRHTTTSRKTKESSFARTNLQTASVLSCSSSEDEEEVSRLPRVRDSLVAADTGENVLIGRAQAFEVRPRGNSRSTSMTEEQQRRPSASGFSMLSQSTAQSEASYSSAGHLEVSANNQTKRHHLLHQQSSISEGAVHPSSSEPSALTPTNSNSTQNLRHELQLRLEHHKLMAVTEEEEALLEMMRSKRAAMAKHSFTQGYRTALKQEEKGKRFTPIHTTTFSDLHTQHANEPIEPLPTSSSGTGSMHSKHLSGSQESALLSPSTTTSVTSSRAQTRQSKRMSTFRAPSPGASDFEMVRSAIAKATQGSSPHLNPYHLPAPQPSSPLDVGVFDQSASPPLSENHLHSVTRRRTPGSRDTREYTTERKSRDRHPRPTPGDEMGMQSSDEDGNIHRSQNPSNNSRVSVSIYSNDQPRSDSTSRRRSGLYASQPRADVNKVKTNKRTSLAVSDETSGSRSVNSRQSHRVREKSTTRRATNESGHGSRNSISEDILAAWGSLGGWRDGEVII